MQAHGGKPHHSRTRVYVHRLVLLMVAFVALSYVRVVSARQRLAAPRVAAALNRPCTRSRAARCPPQQHYAVNNHLMDSTGAPGSRKLAQHTGAAGGRGGEWKPGAFGPHARQVTAWPGLWPRRYPSRRGARRALTACPLRPPFNPDAVGSGGGGQAPPVDALVSAISPVHGFVHKAGMTALANWHPAYAALRKASLKAWLAEKGSLLTGSSRAGLNLLGTKPPFVLHFHDGRGCNIYYNEK